MSQSNASAVNMIHPGRLKLAEDELIKLYDLVKDREIMTGDQMLAKFPYLNGLVKKKNSKSSSALLQ